MKTRTPGSWPGARLENCCRASPPREKRALSWEQEDAGVEREGGARRVLSFAKPKGSTKKVFSGKQKIIDRQPNVSTETAQGLAED